MKKNHPKIHLLFIPTNCTSIFQPADVILQRPFKHAFRQEFNKFTMEVITNQLEGAQVIKVDTKMSTLKPKVCGWLFRSWHQLTTKTEMVKKGWIHTGLLRAFEPEFQKQAMIENIKIPLFKIVEDDIQIDISNNVQVEETCSEVSLDTILEESLTSVAMLTTSNKPTSMAVLRGIARRIPTSTADNTSRSVYFSTCNLRFSKYEILKLIVVEF
jgi:hypothetical protein